MAYTAMKKLIINENGKFNDGLDTAEAYLLWKNNTQNKLDVFYACNRFTAAQYEELSGMLLNIEISEETSTDK